MTDPHYDAKRAEALDRYLARPEFADDPTDDPDFRAAVLNSLGFQLAFLGQLLREVGQELLAPFRSVARAIERIRTPEDRP